MTEVTRTDIADPSEKAAEPLAESTIPVIQDFKGKPTILLNPGSKWPFSLGMGKAKIVLQNVSFLQRFVDTNGTTVE